MRLDDLPDDGEHCHGCGARLPLDRYYGRRMFCSSECYNRHYLQLIREARREAKANRPPCALCGGPVLPEKRSVAIYCSEYCQQKAFHEQWRKRHPRDCRICGTRFYGHNKRQIYCSPRCRAKAGLAVRATRWKPKLTCIQCGAAFKARPGGKHCSQVCRMKTAAAERASIRGKPRGRT